VSVELLQGSIYIVALHVNYYCHAAHVLEVLCVLQQQRVPRQQRELLLYAAGAGWGLQEATSS
jgi:hypothetical protein